MTSRARRSFKTRAEQLQDITGGAISSWFRLDHPGSVVTGLGYSRVEDVLDPSSPATQSTDAQRPPAAVSANGLPILACVADALSVPIIAARNSITTWGFWAHLRRTGGTNPSPVASRALSGSSVNRLDAQAITAADDANIFFWNAASTTARQGRKASAYPVNTWVAVTYEFDGGGATEADRCVITLDGVVQTLLFSDIVGAPGAMPTTLADPTGTISVCAQQLNGTNPWVGNYGPNFGFMGSKMPGSAQGLLTPAARLALSNFERPT